jgi:Tfp pilus assembly protein PilX
MTRPAVVRLRNERGQSLVIALLVMTVLAIALAGVMLFTAGNQRNANVSKAQQVAASLAEAGINNAVSVLSQAAVPGNAGNVYLIPPAGGGNSPLLPNSWATANSNTYSGGTVQWYGTVADVTSGPAASQGWWWTLHAKSTVPNPTGGTAIVRYMSAKVQVNAPTPKSYDVAVWNTVYSPGTGSTCDTSVNQGVTITVPFYVGGNLCMANNGGVNAPVYVGGNLNISNKQAFIGCAKVSSNSCSKPAPINSAHVGGWCAGPSGTQYSPCQSEPMTGGAKDTNIYVNNPTTWNPFGVASDFVGVTAPTICWGPGSCTGDPDGGWYTVSSPGPLNPCATSSGTPPTFDNDTTMNDSVLTTFNLTPSTSYSCTTPQGQLSYNAATQVLTIAGTVFIDGNVTMTTTGNQPITYTGTGSGGACTNVGDCQSVLYASGDISIDSEKLCAVVSGNNCDWNNWDPNKKILIFASNGPNGITVGPSQTSFQGGLYATNTVTTGQSAQTEGPLVSGTRVVNLGQQFGGTFPPITILPLSIQQPPGAFWINPPTDFCNGTGC